MRQLVARMGRHLQIIHLAPMLRVLLEELLDRLEALRDALAVIETVDADDQAPAVDTIRQAAHLRRLRRVTGGAGECVGVDADGEHAGAARPAAGEEPAAAGLPTRTGLADASEIC